MDAYDFVVVGAGASGAVVASRLAKSSSRPSVLLLEAGGSNDSIQHLPATERFNVAFSPDSPLNWNYKTVLQTQLNGQEIDYSRGKGLGGSTAINFCGWVVGPRDDYDEWAELVEDKSFCWQNAKSCLGRIGHLHSEIPQPKLSKYVCARPEDHSTAGPLHLTYGDSWVSDLEDIFMAAEQAGLKSNSDVNSGNPIGMGMGSVCIYKGQRLTSSIAYLSDPPMNLRILSDAGVASVLLDGKRAVGVETLDSRRFYARREVILSAGALNTPQILMLSGIGPREELEKHGIKLQHDLPQLGRNLQDHCFSSVGIVMEEDGRSPHEGKKQSPTPMGWAKLDSVFASKEYKALPRQQQDFLPAPTVPSMEIATHIPPTFLNHTISPGTTFLGAMCLVMNPQSRGTVTLQSPDPKKAPLIDPRFMTHEYDRRVMIEGVRQVQRILAAPVFASRIVHRLGPKDDSEEGIWEHIRCNTGSSWHMSCTARMGTDANSACVDSNFRVFGLAGLRLVDLSICPFVPNNHTQSTAYVVGEIAAEKMIAEYDLDETLPYAML
ncbi:alcohol oxidase [Mollisia scopiformis]|uniref:Alcohol oxidase n=1 Tax=Mollisia scopiformis TaxID=149040 RepID=A0A194X798_MOLSC|nr:alcohol oxidase [Mollisia scopiformis]KUJ16043.1 alcohol oxidase [Mollisia scopiformis]